MGSDEGAFAGTGSTTNSDGDGNGGASATQQHRPKSLVEIKPALRAKSARKTGGAAVSGAGQIKRNGLGVISGGSSDLSAAFGLRPGVRMSSGFERGLPREKRRGLIIGRSGVGIGSPGAPGANDTCSFDPLEDSWSPRRDELSAVELPDVDHSDTLDDLDPFQGLQVR